MKLIYQLTSIIRVTLGLLIKALKDSASLVISNLREVPTIMKAEIFVYSIVDFPVDEVVEDELDAEEQAIYGYSA